VLDDPPLLLSDQRKGLTQSAQSSEHRGRRGDLRLRQQVRAEAAFAGGLNGGIAALGVQLPHDAVDMILDGELGEVQVGGNFFVGQAPGEEGEQLLLPGSEAQFRADPLVQYQGALLSLSRHELKQVKAESGRAHGFALCDAANGGECFLGAGIP